ncbi:hypothetical protein HDA41_003367 [Streptomyces caelestis]|uniref:Uncharacterized protein n=1 Tax=Streptomyces caelestis TaxID=36816 RepID=A0A7W9LTC0_9ACTN|nr:hypothetical protein [Streptomyces caelestis]
MTSARIPVIDLSHWSTAAHDGAAGNNSRLRSTRPSKPPNSQAAMR